MLETQELGEAALLAGRYRVIRRLGSGGMATVVLAEDEVLGREVAVKRLREDRDADLRRFHREARLGATLSHPNLVTVFDTLTGEDGVLIVMEYVPGWTLADELERGRLGTDRALEVLRGVAAALDHAHEAGVVHRDVKPANVLIDERGPAKLADLGIATAAEATRITTANEIVGTLAYLAPERLDSAGPGGPAADVYALAVLAYEMLAGDPPDRGATPAEVVRESSIAPAPDLRDAWLEAPAEAARVLQRGMRREPEMRQGSAGELAEELARALDRPDPAGTAELPPVRPVTALEAARWRPRRVAAAGASIATAALIALVLAIAGGDGDRSTPAADDGGAAGNDAESDATESAAARDSSDGAAPGPTPAADPAALNDRGYALLQQGRPEAAVPVLRRAVASYPEGSRDLTHAYALFNLGSALRLAGRPEEAIPVLERRLEIPNQRGVVRRELDRARAEAA